MRDDQQDEPIERPVSAPPAGPAAEGRDDAAELLREIINQWRATDAKAAADRGWVRSEHYPHGARDAKLAQRLHDEGLIYAINRLVLHPLGIAIGVTGKLSESERWHMANVEGLTLQTTADPEGIEYEPAETVAARNLAKLRAAGHDELADRIEALA